MFQKHAKKYKFYYLFCKNVLDLLFINVYLIYEYGKGLRGLVDNNHLCTWSLYLS